MLSCEKEVESGHGHEERAWVFFFGISMMS